MKLDDLLDVFAVHGVGGIVGSLLVAVLATEQFSGGGLPEGMTVGSQFMAQAGGVIITFVWTAIASFVILQTDRSRGTASGQP